MDRAFIPLDTVVAITISMDSADSFILGVLCNMLFKSPEHIPDSNPHSESIWKISVNVLFQADGLCRATEGCKRIRRRLCSNALNNLCTRSSSIVPFAGTVSCSHRCISAFDRPTWVGPLAIGPKSKMVLFLWKQKLSRCTSGKILSAISRQARCLRV